MCYGSEICLQKLKLRWRKFIAYSYSITKYVFFTKISQKLIKCRHFITPSLPSTPYICTCGLPKVPWLKLTFVWTVVWHITECLRLKKKESAFFPFPKAMKREHRSKNRVWNFRWLQNLPCASYTGWVKYKKNRRISRHYHIASMKPELLI